MEFIVKEKFPLDFLGTEWHDAYINFSLPSLEEDLAEEMPTEDDIKADPKGSTKQMVAKLESHFIDGQGWNGSQLVDLKVEDIRKLPTKVFVKATIFLSGAPDPNS